MKELIAYLTSFFIFLFACLFKLTNRGNNFIFCSMLSFSIIAGFVITNYDVIETIETKFLKIKTAKKEILEAKESALEEIKSEVKNQKESVNLLISNANDTKNKIIEINKSAESKEKELMYLQDILKINQLVVSSKSGSRKDYEELKKIADIKKDIQPFAITAIRDIFFYFDSQREAIGRILMDFDARRIIAYSVDEVIDIYHNEPICLDLRESAINTLAILKQNTSVYNLCNFIDKEQDLRVIARIIRTLSLLTGENFETLDINTVNEWWKREENKIKYKPYYNEFLEALSCIRNKTALSDEDCQYIISLLNKTIEGDSNAFYARCIRADMLSRLGQNKKAENELNEVEKLKKGLQASEWVKFCIFISPVACK